MVKQAFKCLKTCVFGSLLAPTGELYELLCHRGVGRGRRRKKHIFAWHLYPVHRIQTKFGIDILLDPRNKPAKEFFFFSKSKMAAGGQKFAPNCSAMLLEINVFAITWIRFIGFRQNLAWTYYLTLGTSLRKFFHFSQNPRWPPAVKNFQRYTFFIEPNFQHVFSL